jgi:hypothetical protein
MSNAKPKAKRKAKREQSEHNKIESDGCTLPPDHPLPPDQLGRYSPVRDFYAETDIAEYVMGQARDETVQNVERVKTEYVLGSPYEIWDVATDKDRWWVITNPTNLYSQRHFPSLDYTLSFHVGLMMRVASRSERDSESEPTPFDEVFRRQGQAAELLERAMEAVDFQAVGMQLRECLISLVTALRRRVEIDGTKERPKDADVAGWNDLCAAKLCPGEKNDELRRYLKATVEKVWPLVNWLTHHRNANKTAAWCTTCTCSAASAPTAPINVRAALRVICARISISALSRTAPILSPVASAAGTAIPAIPMMKGTDH